MTSQPQNDADETGRLSFRHWLEDKVAGALLTGLRPLPYRWRIAVMGWLGAYVLGPLAGMPARVRANLALIHPDLPPDQVRALCRKVPANMAKAMAETFSGQQFIDHVRASSTISGPGLAALDQARDAKRPVILVTAHFGNYDAGRILLGDRGCQIGAVYMPMRNSAFNDRYVAAMSRISSPVFPRDRLGLAGLLRFLRKGGMVGLVADHYMAHGELIDFMGQPARTALSAAEMALKYDALLVPIYAIRNPDGLSFRIEVQDPVPHSDAMTMTRALNASLEALVRNHMDQWMWTHRRWKNNRPANASEQRVSAQ